MVGRYFTREDSAGSPRVAIISLAVAQRFFHDRSPIGQTIAIGVGAPRADGPLWREIVGVVGDVKDDGLGEAATMTVYEPASQMAWRDMNLFVRSDSDTSQVAATVRSQVVSMDKDQPVGDISTGEQLMAQAVAQPQLRTLLLSVFAALALVLASLGIYGVMSNTVAQRTHEIGVRMALGAGQSSVLRLVLSNGMRSHVARNRFRYSWRVCVDAADERFSFPCDTHRPSDICRGSAIPLPGRAVGELHSSSPRNAGRSRHCPALRVKTQESKAPGFRKPRSSPVFFVGARFIAPFAGKTYANYIRVFLPRT